MKDRLASLDILRGVDMFLLLFLGPVIRALCKVYPDSTAWLAGQFQHADWLKIYGMNAITAYCIGEMINFSSVSQSLLHGFGSLPWYPVVIAFANASLLLGILYCMYKNKVFIKI